MPQVTDFSLLFYNKSVRQVQYGNKNPDGPDDLEKKVLFKIEILKKLMIQRARRSERILKQRLGIIKRVKFLQN